MAERRVTISSGVTNNPTGELNEIITSKYTPLTFLPLFLFLNLNPFLKFANFYFLVVCCLQSIRSISITNGLPTTAVPLLFVLFIEAITDGREDLARHKADAVANGTKAEIFNKAKGEFEVKQWRDIRVGDIVKVHEKEIIPADMLLLFSGNPGRPRSAFVNTKSLDGETDNKYRQAPEIISGTAADPRIKKPADLNTLDGEVTYELPNSKTNDFIGSLVMAGGAPSRLDISSILLRGCILKNTTFVYGLVLNTGKNCKIEFNDKPAGCLGTGVSSKGTSINKVINVGISILCVIMLLTCVVGTAIFNYDQQPVVIKGLTYLGFENFQTHARDNNVFMFFRYFLLNYTIIPISLYVSMSIVYVMQAKLMTAIVNSDPLMASADKDIDPLIVRSATLNDELGQVTHIFSDKTGTLTKNLMVFRMMIVDGMIYGKGVTEIGIARMKAMGEDTSKADAILAESQAIFKKQVGIDRYCNYTENEACNFFQDIKKSGSHADKLHDMCLNMALNHSVFTEKDEAGVIQLSASSADEQAFVSAANRFGYQFISRDLEKGSIKLMIDGSEEVYEVLGILEYTNFRKRMSVIVQIPDGTTVLFSKGADNVIMERLSRENNAKVVKETADLLGVWAEDALRTMAFGFKVLSKSAYNDWRVKFAAANQDADEIEKRKRGLPNRIDDLMDEIEMNMMLQGATAVEDQLQEGVSTSLASYINAGISVWMITGDKVGTAKNIAIACNLLKDPKTMVWVELTTEEIDHELKATITEAQSLKELPVGEIAKVRDLIVKAGLTMKSMKDKSTDFDRSKAIEAVTSEIESRYPGLATMREKITKMSDIVVSEGEGHLPVALIIDEKLIDYSIAVFEYELLQLAQNCAAVVCCRARKDQKAAMVSLIKNNVPTAVTLAIGDGANDVDMIKGAHIGIGVNGKEGKQAMNNSDFAVGQFKILSQLLFVHGRYNYRRMSFLTVIMFWKNILVALTQYIYAVSRTNASGQKFYPESALQLYGQVYTALCIVVFAVFDRDVPPEAVFRYPKLYREGIDKALMNHQRFWMWILYAVFCCVFLSFIPLQWMEHNSGPGYDSAGVFDLGTITFTIVILMANSQVSMEQDLSTPLTNLIYFGSNGMWFLFLALTPYFKLDIDIYNISSSLFKSKAYWSCVLFCLVTHVMLVKSRKWISRTFFPTAKHVIQELYRGSTGPPVAVRSGGVIAHTTIPIGAGMGDANVELTPPEKKGGRLARLATEGKSKSFKAAIDLDAPISMDEDTAMAVARSVTGEESGGLFKLAKTPSKGAKKTRGSVRSLF